MKMDKLEIKNVINSLLLAEMQPRKLYRGKISRTEKRTEWQTQGKARWIKRVRLGKNKQKGWKNVPSILFSSACQSDWGEWK